MLPNTRETVRLDTDEGVEVKVTRIYWNNVRRVYTISVDIKISDPKKWSWCDSFDVAESDLSEESVIYLVSQIVDDVKRTLVVQAEWTGRTIKF